MRYSSCHTIHPFKVCDFFFKTIFTLGNHYQILDHFHHLKSNSMSFALLPFEVAPYPLQPQTTNNLAYCRHFLLVE